MTAIIYNFPQIKASLERLQSDVDDDPDDSVASRSIPGEDSESVFRIYFEPGRIVIPEKGYVVLDRVAEVVKAAPGCTISIHAYTDIHSDAAGADGQWMMLGVNRGLIIRHGLMVRGATGHRIEVTSHGPVCERHSRDTTIEGPFNRRVEIRVRMSHPGET
jgi:outer membrane protein OmpA-like peptidoglycan-associated protein